MTHFVQKWMGTSEEVTFHVAHSNSERSMHRRDMLPGFPAIYCTASHQPTAEEQNVVIIEMGSSGERHNERGQISIIGRMQLNKHYAAQTQCLKSYSNSPSVLARCWRPIRDSALEELLFILSMPLPMKETLGRQWPKETEKHFPLWLWRLSWGEGVVAE